jgi:hypothetical protein
MKCMTNLKITEWYRLPIEEMYDKLKYSRVVDDDRTIAFSLMKCLTNLDITEWHNIELDEIYEKRKYSRMV